MAERHPVRRGDRPPEQRLYRPRKNRLIAGVCAGIARYLGWSTLNVRIAYVAVSAISAAFPGIIVYLILWLLMPEEPGEPRSSRVG